jgi:hypothetical protein
MSKRKSKSSTRVRAPPTLRPDPDGIDADAESTVGKLRKILYIIILTIAACKYKQFCVDYGLSNYEDFIKTHATWYRVHQSWDPKEQPTREPTPRFSQVRNKIAEIYNSMSFPRHFQDLYKRLIAIGYRIRPWLIFKYLRQLKVFPSKISRCLNPTKQSTCVERVEGAKRMKGELIQLTAARARNPDDDRTKWYYYDQAPFQQMGPKRDVVLGPRNVKIYDPKKITLIYPSITLHMIVDQDGEVNDVLFYRMYTFCLVHECFLT